MEKRLLLSLLLLIELILVTLGIVFLLGIALYCSEYLHTGLLSPGQVYTAISPAFYG